MSGGIVRGTRGRRVEGSSCPYFGGLEHGKTDDFQATLLKLCDFSICACIYDDVCEDVVGLKVVERDDHSAGGSCGGGGSGDGRKGGDGGIARSVYGGI